MDSPSLPFELPLQRHRLVRVAPAAWDAVLASRADLPDIRMLRDWARHGRPLIVRRPLPDDAPGVALGLPLPPSAGKRRIAVTLQRDDLVSVVSLPSLREVMASAPDSWRSSLCALVDLGDAYDAQPGVFGSLAWQCLTGLAYLGPHSDLDIAWTLPKRSRVDAFLDTLADIDAHAPMRIDGELLRDDGAGVNWRELYGGEAEVVVKTSREVSLRARADFLTVSP